jgi:diacylglycerol kinase family enzyme
MVQMVDAAEIIIPHDTSRFTHCHAPTHVVAIVNPNASSGLGPRLIRFLERRVWPSKVEVFLTSPRSLEVHREAIEYARRVNADRLIVAGGDGMVMESLTAMLDSGPPLPVSLIPIGTANIVAGDLGIPRTMRGALKLAFSEATLHWWDIGQEAHAGYFFALRASAGHDANTLTLVNPDHKNRWRTIAYALPAIREFVQMRPVEFTLTIDNQAPIVMEGITAFVAVTGRVFGQIDFVLSRRIQTDDGVLSAGVIHPKKILQNVPKILRQMALEGDNMLSIFSVQQVVSIDANPPQRTQVDGDLLGHTPLTARVIARAVPFVTPRRPL